MTVKIAVRCVWQTIYLRSTQLSGGGRRMTTPAFHLAVARSPQTFICLSVLWQQVRR
jgi:hypothetical protein